MLLTATTSSSIIDILDSRTARHNGRKAKADERVAQAALILFGFGGSIESTFNQEIMDKMYFGFGQFLQLGLLLFGPHQDSLPVTATESFCLVRNVFFTRCLSMHLFSEPKALLWIRPGNDHMIGSYQIRFALSKVLANYGCNLSLRSRELPTMVVARITRLYRRRGKPLISRNIWSSFARIIEQCVMNGVRSTRVIGEDFWGLF